MEVIGPEIDFDRNRKRSWLSEDLHRQTDKKVHGLEYMIDIKESEAEEVLMEKKRGRNL